MIVKKAFRSHFFKKLFFSVRILLLCITAISFTNAMDVVQNRTISVSFNCTDNKTRTVSQDELTEDFCQQYFPESLLEKFKKKIMGSSQSQDKIDAPATDDILKIGFEIIKTYKAQITKLDFTQEAERKLFVDTVNSIVGLDSITINRANEILDILIFLNLPDSACSALSDSWASHLRALKAAQIYQRVSVNMRDFSDDEKKVGVRPASTLSFCEYAEQLVKNQINTPPAYQRQMALNFLKRYKKHHLYEDIVDEQTWQDLEIFCGKAAGMGYCAKMMDRTQTEMGRVILMHKIAACSIDKDKLQKNRKIIELLSQNSGIYDSLKSSLAKLAEAEKGVFSFWDPNDWFDFNTPKLKVPLVSRIPFASKLPIVKDYNDLKIYGSFANENSTVVTAHEWANYAETLFLDILRPLYKIAGIDPSAVISAITSGSLHDGYKMIQYLNTFVSISDEHYNNSFLHAAILLKLVHLRFYLNELQNIQKELENLRNQGCVKYFV